jgi:hypothetical protein
MKPELLQRQTVENSRRSAGADLGVRGMMVSRSKSFGAQSVARIYRLENRIRREPCRRSGGNRRL